MKVISPAKKQRPLKPESVVLVTLIQLFLVLISIYVLHTVFFAIFLAGVGAAGWLTVMIMFWIRGRLNASD